MFLPLSEHKIHGWSGDCLPWKCRQSSSGPAHLDKQLGCGWWAGGKLLFPIKIIFLTTKFLWKNRHFRPKCSHQKQRFQAVCVALPINGQLFPKKEFNFLKMWLIQLLLHTLPFCNPRCLPHSRFPRSPSNGPRSEHIHRVICPGVRPNPLEAKVKQPVRSWPCCLLLTRRSSCSRGIVVPEMGWHWGNLVV